MLIFHPDGDKFHIEKVQDVEPILEWNKVARSERQNGEFSRHKARIPNVIYERWFHELAQGNPRIAMFGPEMDEYVERKLKDPEWAYLRTDSAQVQGWMGFGS
jgi:hypothetical protein